MKAIKMISKSLLVGLMLMLTTSLYAQETMKEESNGSMNSNSTMNSNDKMNMNDHMKVILDNEKVQVMQVEIPAGTVIPMHQDPENVGYVLAGGKMEVTKEGQEPMVMDLNEGDAMYMPAESHMLKNVGTTTVKLVVTTMKSGNKMMKEDSAMDKKSDKW